MKCPKCKKEGCRYVETKNRKSIPNPTGKGDIRFYDQRTNFKAFHNCGFEGEVF